MALLKWVGQVIALSAGLGVVWMTAVFFISGELVLAAVFAGLSVIAYTAWQRVREREGL